MGCCRLKLAGISLFCMFALSAIPAAGDEVDDLVGALASNDLAVRQNASRRLMELAVGDPESILERLPSDSKDPEVSSACDVLRKCVFRERLKKAISNVFEDEKIVQRIEEGMFGDDEDQRRAIISFLYVDSKKRDESAPIDPKRRPQVLQVMRFLEEEGLLAQRWYAVLAIGYLRDQGSVPRLLALRDDPDPGIRAAAVWSLGQMRSMELIKEIQKAFQDRDVLVRWAAFQALIHAKGEWEHLTTWLRQPDVWTGECHVMELSAPEDVCDSYGFLSKRSLVLRRDDSLEGVGQRIREEMDEWKLVPYIVKWLDSSDAGLRTAASLAIRHYAGKEWEANGAGSVPAAKAWWDRHRNEKRFDDPSPGNR